jgi:gamma-butyrobetaine dioxygenase
VLSPIEVIAGLFAGEGVRSYLGEEVSLAEHMLQAAALAERSGAAKRYLCTVEPGYAGRLSPASVHTLALQGGPLTQAEAQAFKRLPHALNAVAVRRWDEAAKEPTVAAPPFDYFRSLLK